MKLKKGNNPILKSLEENTTKRSVSKSALQPIKNSENILVCAWCAEIPIPNKRNKYCSEECRESATVFCYPQSASSIPYLLERQDFKCNICKYNYLDDIKEGIKTAIRINNNSKPYRTYNKEKNEKLEELLKKETFTARDYNSLSIWYFTRPTKERSIEIDHIVPVALGGKTLSLDNVQGICYSCHKVKTKEDRKKMKENGYDKKYLENKQKDKEKKEQTDKLIKEAIEQFNKEWNKNE